MLAFLLKKKSDLHLASSAPSGIGDLKKNTKDYFQIGRFVEKNESFGSLALYPSWAPYSVWDKFISMQSGFLFAPNSATLPRSWQRCSISIRLRKAG
jgi:hypothetical protein